jgi:hypothetical protein
MSSLKRFMTLQRRENPKKLARRIGGDELTKEVCGPVEKGKSKEVGAPKSGESSEWGSNKREESASLNIRPLNFRKSPNRWFKGSYALAHLT